MIRQQNKIKIALIDSGVDAYHQDLRDCIDLDNAQSYIKEDPSFSDNLGHGTEVTGVLKTTAPCALITPYKVVNKKKGNSLDVIKAIISAVKNGSDVINISMGTYKNTLNKKDSELIKLYKKAIDYANKKNIIIVSSLGNDDLNLDFQFAKNKLIHIPSNFDNTISVASLNRNQELSAFSNYYEDNLFFAAFGGEFVLTNDKKFSNEELIYTTFPRYLNNPLSKNNGYSFTGGCSVSAAMMSGTVANIIGIYKTFYRNKPTYDEIIKIIKKLSVYKSETHNGHTISYFSLNTSHIKEYYAKAF